MSDEVPEGNLGGYLDYLDGLSGVNSIIEAITQAELLKAVMPSVARQIESLMPGEQVTVRRNTADMQAIKGAYTITRTFRETDEPDKDG